MLDRCHGRNACSTFQPVALTCHLSCPLASLSFFCEPLTVRRLSTRSKDVDVRKPRNLPVALSTQSLLLDFAAKTAPCYVRCSLVVPVNQPFFGPCSWYQLYDEATVCRDGCRSPSLG